MTSLHIKSVRLIDPANQQDCITDVYIDNGIIIAIGDAPINYKNNELIDAEGLWLLPGIVDLSVYLREPGQENKATIQHEMNVAIRSGITTVCAMPEPLSPIDSGACINLINEKHNRLMLLKLRLLVLLPMA